MKRQTAWRRFTRLVVASAAIFASLPAAPARAAVPFSRFEPVAEELSWVDAYLLAIASGQAYRGRVQDLEGRTYAEKFRHLYEPLGLEVLAFVESDEVARTGAQALVLRNESIVLVVFCGTEGHDRTAAVRDMLTDAKVWPLPVDGVKVHRGFHYALESVWEELSAAVAGPLAEGLALWLTGHSLGGALANLAAYRFDGEGVHVAGVYTFGAPKIGDAALVARLEQRLGARSQQWSTTLDPIPRLPEINRRAAYEKLGVTNLVSASGEAELATVQRMSGVLNPLAHRITAYVNYLYRALPEDVRAKVPAPPALCSSATRQVGVHPENDYPMCRDSLRKIRRRQCLEQGGKILEPWCLREEAGKFRYLAQKLKQD